MIEVINRELLIPREEYNIGTCYDDNTETRHFHLKRVTSGGVDLAALTFNLDILYANGSTDAASLLKEVTDKDINLVLTINNSMLQVPGTVLIQIRALDEDGVCKWTSYKSAFFVEDHINTPGHYEGDLTQLEQYEAEWGKVRDNVNQLNYRMDQIAKISEGSIATEVEQEVVDARVGADNVVYGSLGTAIRKQFENVYEEMEDDTEDWTAAVAAEATARAESVSAEATARTSADTTLQNNINSEASLRASTDTTLQNNITSEASSRASADTALGARIDQLVAPSGEAPSAAEVLDARVGANGTTYQSLGAAIRGQVESINSELNAKVCKLKRSLSNNTDLNTVIDNGWFLVATSYSLINSPEESDTKGYRYIIVLGESSQTATSNKTMIYRNAKTGVFAVRAYSGGSSGSWSNWTVIPNKADVDSSIANINDDLNTKYLKIVRALSNGTDLNTIYENGWYVVGTSYTLTNSPETNSTTGYRFIFIYGLSNPNETSNKLMVYYNIVTKVYAIRAMRTLTWGDWVIIPTQDYVDNAITDFNSFKVPYMRCMSWEVFPDDTQDDYYMHRILGSCLCKKKIAYALEYDSSNPYYLGTISLQNLLFKGGTINKYNIVLNIGGIDTPMNTLSDGDGTEFDIVDMKSDNEYLYLALRGGSGLPDLTKVNGYMVAINTDDMSVIGYDTSAGRTSGLCIFENYLISGEMAGGWSVYKLTDHVPARIYRYAVESFEPYEGEWQHPCAFRNNGSLYIAIARYTKGVDVYAFDEINNTAELVCSWDSTALGTIGSNLNVFAVKAAYPYIYATIAPKTSSKMTGNNTMGIVTIDITNTSDLTYTFEKIPDAACGILPQYYSIANDGTMTLVGGGDPAPNCLWIDNGYIYANNEEQGIAVFKINGNKTDYKGNIDVGVWTKYFDMKQGIIFANSRFDYERNGKPLITATRPIVYS